MSNPSPVGWAIITSLALLGARSAHAQVPEAGLGLVVGYASVNRAVAGIAHAFPFSLQGTLYLDRRLELIAELPVQLLRLDGRSGVVVGIAPSLGIRYLFWDELIRPYLGLQLGYLRLFDIDGASNFVGPALNLGIEVLATETVAIGVRSQFNIWAAPGTSALMSFGSYLTATRYFF